MRWKIPASVLLVLALLIPASTAVAQTGSSRLDETTCQAVVYTDIRELFVVDLDTASDLEIRMLANRISSVAGAESLTGLYEAVQELLRNGSPDEIRAFLQEGWQTHWTIDLRVTVLRTMGDPAAGANVRAAAQEALDDGTIDTFLTYLNHGLYVARALDAGWSLEVHTDIRGLFVVDLDTASDLEIRMLANRISSVAGAESLTGLYEAVQELLRNGSPDEIRAFLQEGWQTHWTMDLRVTVLRTMGDPAAGANVRAAAQEALDDGTIDTFLTYLNHGLYVARALDACESQPA
ncbi:ALF repeat-containing protein [Actinophytocola algeriensis]|uniref:Uncharacterized protein n=1 Tax=Actinophytocola algeriensis TaxID=1768010 RepID=A0A7W7Q7Y5_9PSEU|nr:ALF repeat-containing protein [Actinophytocola algeriensis]MBB4908762.1 hypothetical protein [Actinophytocola algeriensis]MBE1474851.1 hypothetical protein [Actinophytocola algeriensis]